MRLCFGLPVRCAGAMAAAGSAAFAQEPPTTSSPPTSAAPGSVTAAADQVAGEPASEAPAYGGDWRERGCLSGDWGGRRDRMAESGLSFELRWTQIAQGIVSGGARRDWDYGGNLDAAATADLRPLLGLGGEVLVRAESRYGETVNDDAGSFTPVDTRGYFPLATGINEGIPVTITELSYTVELTDGLSATVGKMITIDGDPVEFAGGRGRTQFLNSNFIYNAATSQTSPYSTLGALVDWSPAPWITVSSAVFATPDSSTTTGFNHLNQGWTWWAQAATQYRLGNLPGGLNAGFQYAFGGEFTALNGSTSSLPGEGPGIETVSQSWAIFAGGWQYLWTPDADGAEVDAFDDRADLRGVGVLARLGFGDPDANLVRWSGSVGLGARGLLPGRGLDTLGVGYYFTDVQESDGLRLLGVPSSSQGFEAFYNVAITPAVGLSVDVQWVDEGLEGTDPATVAGLRLDIAF